MNLAAIVLAIGGLLASGAPRRASDLAFAQPTQPQQAAQTASSQQNPPTPPPVPATKPCPATSQSASVAQPDCTPFPKGKKATRRHPTDGSVTSPTTKVVRNGSTSDPDVAISPGVSRQQASQQLETTNHLLAKTDDNLKIISSRQLSASQQDTVKQIRSYMEQSRKASHEGDVQRAYTLANKARMLSGDLLKH